MAVAVWQRFFGNLLDRLDGLPGAIAAAGRLE